jgi:hypothetical protein
MLWPMGVTNESSEFISNLYQHRRRESCGKTVQRTIREHIDIWSAFPRGIADVEHIPVLFHSTILKVIQGQYISMSVCTAHQSFFISASLEFKRRSLFKFYLLRTNVLNTELLVKLGAFFWGGSVIHTSRHLRTQARVQSQYWSTPCHLHETAFRPWNTKLLQWI